MLAGGMGEEEEEEILFSSLNRIHKISVGKKVNGVLVR
jgi:hypothetical protein